MKEKIQAFLKRFSFRTGVVVLIMCIPCYYGGLTIVGVDGMKRIKEWWKTQKYNFNKY